MCLSLLETQTFLSVDTYLSLPLSHAHAFCPPPSFFSSNPTPSHSAIQELGMLQCCFSMTHNLSHFCSIVIAVSRLSLTSPPYPRYITFELGKYRNVENLLRNFILSPNLFMTIMLIAELLDLASEE